MERLLRVDPAEWVEAVAAQEEFFNSFGTHLPRGMRDEHESLARRVQEAISPTNARESFNS